MKTADAMFENLGYKKHSNDTFCLYQKSGKDFVDFSLVNEAINIKTSEKNWINMKLFKAIQTKLKELEWLE